MMDDRATRVRVGPLAPYADEFWTVLAERGYTPSSAAGQVQLMAHVSRWLVNSGLDGRDLTPATVETFLQERSSTGTPSTAEELGTDQQRDLTNRRASRAASTPPAVLTQQARRDAGELDPRGLEDLVQALNLSGALLASR